MRIQILLNFKRMSDQDAYDFAFNIITQMKGNTRFSTEQPRVLIVEQAVAEFRVARDNASDGGRTPMIIKNQKRKNMDNELTDLALEVQLNAKGDPSYATDAGFQLRKKPVINRAVWSAPEWNYLRRGKQSGTVVGAVKDLPGGVEEVGIAYSTDGWVTEHNGTYSTGKQFTLKGLPTEQPVEVKVCYQGTHQRKSDFSMPMRVFVL